MGPRSPSTTMSKVLVPMGRYREPTFMYLDVSLGYWIYRSDSQNRYLTGLAPVVEVHVNQSLEKSPVLSSGDNQVGGDMNGNPINNITIVDLMVGLHAELCEKTTLTAAYCVPATGDRQFDGRVPLLPQPAILISLRTEGEGEFFCRPDTSSRRDWYSALVGSSGANSIAFSSHSAASAVLPSLAKSAASSSNCACNRLTLFGSRRRTSAKSFAANSGLLRHPVAGGAEQQGIFEAELGIRLLAANLNRAAQVGRGPVEVAGVPAARRTSPCRRSPR